MLIDECPERQRSTGRENVRGYVTLYTPIGQIPRHQTLAGHLHGNMLRALSYIIVLMKYHSLFVSSNALLY